MLMAKMTARIPVMRLTPLTTKSSLSTDILISGLMMSWTAKTAAELVLLKPHHLEITIELGRHLYFSGAVHSRGLAMETTFSSQISYFSRSAFLQEKSSPVLHMAFSDRENHILSPPGRWNLSTPVVRPHTHSPDRRQRKGLPV